jgi:hypothetical protein
MDDNGYCEACDSREKWMKVIRAIIVIVVCAAAAFAVTLKAHAQVANTRVSAFDWQCQDEAGARISDHQREGTAIVACINAPSGAYVQGGRYRIRKPSAPVVEPAPAPAPAGTAVLSWTPPTTNTDGSTLADLAGYRIYYGTSPDALTATVQVANPSTVSHTLTGLAPGTYYFGVKAYTSTGIESAISNVVTKVVT